MKNKLVSIIVVNWNGLRWLPDCFDSLAKQDWKNYEIIFVDNASEDESVSWVKKHYPKTKVVTNKTNLGFSDANNVAYKAASGEFVLFLNNDTRVTKTFLTELVKVLERDGNIGGAQSKILLMDHPDTHDSVGAFLTPTGFLYHYGFRQKDSTKFDKQIDLYTAKGACMMFRKSVLDEVAINGNIFDPDYFAYFEETDMCHRVWIAGFKTVYAYKSVIYHKMGATSSSMNNALIQYHSFKNRIHTYIKNLGSKSLWQVVPLHLFLCICYATYSILRGKFRLGFAVLKAIWWNIKHFSDMVRSRRFIQESIRNKSDVEFFPIIMKYPSLSYYKALLMGDNAYE
jgi:GT2 family glycosyltransferase